MWRNGWRNEAVSHIEFAAFYHLPTPLFSFPRRAGGRQAHISMSSPWHQNDDHPARSDEQPAQVVDDHPSTPPRFSLVDDQYATTPPRTPSSPTHDALLLPAERAPSRSLSSPNFVSSPLNPRAPSSLYNGNNNGKFRPSSRASMNMIRMASEDSRALAVDSPYPGMGMGPGQRGSMVLYRLATEDEQGELLPPPTLHSNNRVSVASSSGDSIFSLSSDSKYPSGVTYGQRGLVPYAYDPDVDDKEPPDEEDMLHDPDDKRPEKTSSLFAMRGFLNVGVLLLLIIGLLCLFIFYPVLSFIRNNARNLAIDGNIRINGTGQAPVL